MTKMIIPAKPETQVCRNTANQAMIRQAVGPGRSAVVCLDLADIPQIVTWLQALAEEIRTKPDPQEQP